MICVVDGGVGEVSGGPAKFLGKDIYQRKRFDRGGGVGFFFRRASPCCVVLSSSLDEVPQPVRCKRDFSRRT